MAAPPIPSFTGGAATATSGPARGEARSAFSAPVVIGGFKTDGTASATLPIGTLLIGAGVVAALALLWLFTRRRS